MSGWPVVAGIPLVVHGAPADSPSHWLLPDWEDAPARHDPLEIGFEVGETDGDGLQLLIGSDDPMVGSYYADERGELAVRASTVDDAAPQLMRTERPGHRYTIRYARAGDLGPLQWRWPRNVFTHALAARRLGLVAHAAGALLPSGRAIVLPGVSGQGKTTAARVLHEAGAVILSDDRIAITLEGGVGEPWAWGTPWYSAGHFASGRGAPLGALVFPERGGDEPALGRLSRSEALRRVMRLLAYPVWSPALMDFALALTSRCIERVPAFALAYTPAHDVGARVVAMVEDALAELAHV